MWEGVGDRTELQHIDPHSYGHQRCVFLVLQGCSTGGPGLRFLLSAGFLYHILSPTSLISKLTDFLSSPSYIIVQSPTQSLEWHVWSSSSGNNCHAVHRSLSSSASVYDCTAGFYLVPFCQPSSPTPMEYALPPYLEWHIWPGRRSIYNKISISCKIPSWSPFPPNRVKSYTPFTLVCNICLLCHQSFRLCHHIICSCNFVAYYRFWLSYN